MLAHRAPTKKELPVYCLVDNLKGCVISEHREARFAFRAQRSFDKASAEYSPTFVTPGERADVETVIDLFGVGALVALTPSESDVKEADPNNGRVCHEKSNVKNISRWTGEVEA